MKSIVLTFFFAVLWIAGWGQTLSPLSLEQLVNTDIPPAQFSPKVAAAPDGSYVVIWIDGQTYGTLKARRYDSSHNPVTGEITITSSASKFLNIEHWKNGKYVISYIDGAVLKFHVLDELNVVAPAITVSTTVPFNKQDFAIKGDSLAFLYGRDANKQLYLRGYNLSTNAWINAEVRVTEVSGYSYVEAPNIIYHNDGRLTAIYHLQITTGCCVVERKIMRKTFNSSFVAEIPEQIIWAPGVDNYVGADMDASGNSNGEVVIATTHGEYPGTNKLRLWILSSTGTFIVNNSAILTGNSYTWHEGTVAQLYDNGDYVVGKSLWVNLPNGNAPTPNYEEVYVIYGKNYNQSRTGILQVNSTSADEQEQPCLAKLPNGGFVAAWSGNGFQGDTRGIYTRAYNAVSFPGVAFSTNGTYSVSEAGTTATIGIVLGTQPTGNVTVDLSSSDLTEGTVSPTQLTFTPTNWNQVQNVVVTGVDDTDDDGDITFNLVASTTGSADATYAALPNKTQAIVNRDNDATITMPSAQTICKSTGMSNVNALISNVGAAITSVTAVSNNQSVIDNSDITITNAGGGTYGITINNLSNNSLGTAQVTLTANDGQFNYTGSFNVTTTGVAIVTSASSHSICQGQTVTLSATGGQNISWNNGVVNNVPFTPLATATYTVTADNGSGCTGTATETITVNSAPAAPTVNASGSLSLCGSGSVTLTSSQTTGNTWSTGETTQSITVSNAGTYSVTYSTGGTCSATSAPVVVTVNSAPATPVITPNGSTTFCAGGSVTLTSSQATGNTWSTGETTQSIVVSNAGNYTVSVSNGTCSAASAPAVITVNSNPAVPTITPNGATTFCAGGSVILTSSSATGNSWSTGVTSQTINVTATNTYLLTYTDGNGCTSQAASILVTAQALPNVSAGPDQTVCKGTTITLLGSGATSYSWTGGITNGTPFPVNNQATFEVTGTGSNGCTNTDQVTVFVNNLPTVSAGQNRIVCNGASVTLNGSGAVTYNWDNGVTNGVSFVPTLGTTTYTVTGTDANGCEAEDEMTLTVNPLPGVTLSAIPAFCISNGSAVLNQGLPAGGTYSGNGISGTVFNPSTAGVGIHPVTYTYTDQNNCQNTASSTITVDQCLGINELTANQLVVYPNPTVGFTTIEFPGSFSYSVSDAQGRTILDGIAADGTKLDLSAFSGGVYQLIIQAENTFHTVRIVKN
ncbi:T9SS type A sorting domain-containing protein [Fluviicola sp.]|uniref:beta strand repeat-containing protein n=1 Tax=Fluviicola sp. TaxID=1917219 RepID=UPI002622002F|nr:T9SS type A sorting domain-containing protein [Fluviicola sp.]